MNDWIRPQYSHTELDSQGNEVDVYAGDARSGAALALVTTPVGWAVSVVGLVFLWPFLPALSALGCGLYANKRARGKQLKTRVAVVLLCSLGAFAGVSAIQNTVAPSQADAPSVERVAG